MNFLSQHYFSLLISIISKYCSCRYTDIYSLYFIYDILYQLFVYILVCCILSMPHPTNYLYTFCVAFYQWHTLSTICIHFVYIYLWHTLSAICIHFALHFIYDILYQLLVYILLCSIYLWQSLSNLFYTFDVLLSYEYI